MPRTKSPKGKARALIQKGILIDYVNQRGKALGSLSNYARHLTEISGVSLHRSTVAYWAREDTAPNEMDWQNLVAIAADRGETTEETISWLQGVRATHPLIERLRVASPAVCRKALEVCLARETALSPESRKRILREIVGTPEKVESKDSMNGASLMVDFYGERISLSKKERQRLLNLISATARHEGKTEEQFRAELKIAGVSDRTLEEIEGTPRIFYFKEAVLGAFAVHLQSVSCWKGPEGADPCVLDRKLSGFQELKFILEMNGQSASLV